MPIDLQKLDQMTRDVIELREQTDQTFYNFCIEENELLFVNGELKPIKQVVVGDKLVGDRGQYVDVLRRESTKKTCLKINTDCLGSFVVSEDHKMVLYDGSLIRAKDLVKGLPLKCVIDSGNAIKRRKVNDYLEGFFAGSYLADGHSIVFKHKLKPFSFTRYIRFTNQDKKLLASLGSYAVKMGAVSYIIKKLIVKKNYLQLYRLQINGKLFVEQIVSTYGRASGNFSSTELNLKKHIPLRLLKNQIFSKGFIDGFTSCDFCCGGKLASNGSYSISSKYVRDCLVYALRMFGFKPSIKEYSRLNNFNHIRQKDILNYSQVSIVSNELDEFLSFISLGTKHKQLSKNFVISRRNAKENIKPRRATPMFISNGSRLPIVTSVERVGVKNCVDLEVSGNRLFVLGGGLVVHNCERDYSDWFWNMLAERSNPDVEHSAIVSVTGMQGCHSAKTQITTKTGLKNIEDIVSGDLVWSGGAWRPCILIKKGVQQTLKVTLRNGIELNMTSDHVMFTQRGEVAAQDMIIGDILICGDAPGQKQMLDEEITIVNIVQSNIEEVFDLHVKDVHEYLANGLKSKNSGKSLSSISMCCFMDSTFSADKIYFNYDRLVQDRSSLKSNTSVLVDEQSQAYGLDSHRIMIILSNLKEQLRKKSIHFFFCAPVLYEESKSSMYIIETMFIDYETQEVYAALKTREGLTLGHVRIPHPLKIIEGGNSLASKELMDAYQAKKDVHLETVLGNKDVDIFEERAQFIMKRPEFLQAEQIYLKKMGYIPQSMLIQLINKLAPEYKSGVVPLEIAGRIKLDKEISGKWEVAGAKKKEHLTKSNIRSSTAKRIVRRKSNG